MSQKILKIDLLRAKRAEIFGKLCTFPPKSSKFRSDYLFSFQKRTDNLFPGFLRSEYLFPKSASTPLRIKWSSSKAFLLMRLGKFHANIYKLQLNSPKRRNYLQINMQFLSISAKMVFFNNLFYKIFQHLVLIHDL